MFASTSGVSCNSDEFNPQLLILALCNSSGVASLSCPAIFCRFEPCLCEITLTAHYEAWRLELCGRT